MHTEAQIQTRSGHSFCRATPSFRGVQRYDCVCLLDEILVSESLTCKYAQLLWIVSKSPSCHGAKQRLCIALPLCKWVPLTHTPAQLVVARTFEMVERQLNSLICFGCEKISHIEQVQFLASDPNRGIVNHFYRSTIFDSESNL